MSKHKFQFSAVFLALGLAASTQATAGFEIEGNTIVFTDNDWYQVQTPDNFVTICNGASSCTVATGSYIVINHNTGERWEQVGVPPTGDSTMGGDNSDTGSDPESSTGDVADMSNSTTLGSLIINGSLLTFSDNDWYQVQRPDDFQTVCEGVDSCMLDDGTYIVINHSTGVRYEEVMISTSMTTPAAGDVADSGNGDSGNGDGGNSEENSESADAQEIAPALLVPAFDGESIRWPDDGWYQVQNTLDFSTVCEGGRSCALDSGSYILINLTTGERWEDISIVSGMASAVGDNMAASETDASGGEAAPLDPPADSANSDGGVMEPDNDDVEVMEPAAVLDPSPAPIVEGNTLILGGTGWYQVQSAADFNTVCSGLLICEVPRGIYNVINHTTGERFDNIAVFDNSGVWFGTTAFGEGVFVIGTDGLLYGLSSRDDGLYEAVFGSVDGSVRRYLHLPSRNPGHGTSFNLLGERPENFNSFDMNDVMYNLAVNNEGQQLTNSGIGGNFSLTFATADDVMPITLQSVVGQWESRSAFCPSDCDITVVLDITSSGFVSGTTQVNDSAQSQLAGSVAMPGNSNLYLNIEFLLNGERRAGVVYFDRFSDSLILNSIGVDTNTGSMSAVLQRN